MSPAHRLLPLLLLCFGCSKLLAKDAPPADEAPAEARSEEQAAEAEAPEPPGAERAASPPGGRYGIPFAYERSPDEPLAKARQFMADVLEDNVAFLAPGRDRAGALSSTESPRATVLTCSESRVQPSVWDATPDNDSYTVRDLGNQLGTALGSVEYGVEVLRTPVLLIIGHTGCEAVAGATKHTGRIAEELSRIEKPQKARAGKEGRGGSGAVLANVNAQVKEAVGHFAPRVQSGDLTIVGAVYDPTNELGKGAGRLHLVNINGNVDAARVKAFEDAVKEHSRKASAGTKRRGPEERARGFLDGSSRLAPGARATINAVSVVGSGGLEALGEAGFRQSMSGLSHDVRPARERRPGSFSLARSQGDGSTPAAAPEAPAPEAGGGAPAAAAPEDPPEAASAAPAPPRPAPKPKPAPSPKRKKPRPATEPATTESTPAPGAEPPPLPWK